MYAVMLTYLIAAGVSQGDLQVAGPFDAATCASVIADMGKHEAAPGYIRTIGCVKGGAALNDVISTRGCELREAPVPINSTVTLYHYFCGVG